MAQTHEQYVITPPPEYAPAGQQTGILPAAPEPAPAAPEPTPAAPESTTTAPEIVPAEQLGQPTEHADEKEVVAHPENGTTAPAASAQPIMVIPLDKLGDQPGVVDCPYCRKATQTRVAEESSTTTYLYGLILGIFCICLACVPCCAGMAQDVDHYCSSCGNRLTHRPYSNGIVQVVATGVTGAAPSSHAVASKYA